MPNATDTEVRQALQNALKSIKTANGYEVDLLDKNFRTNHDPKAQARGQASEYPKVLFAAGDVGRQREVSRRTKKITVFYVVIVTLYSEAPGGSKVEPLEQCEKIVGEVEKMVERNMTLGGTVETLNLLSVSYDSGFLYPEGVAVLEFQTERNVQNL